MVSFVGSVVAPLLLVKKVGSNPNSVRIAQGSNAQAGANGIVLKKGLYTAFHHVASSTTGKLMKNGQPYSGGLY